jgi:hypothetical protein
MGTGFKTIFPNIKRKYVLLSQNMQNKITLNLKGVTPLTT